jgi:predicted nucleic acid-binding Zn ribbon protein
MRRKNTELLGEVIEQFLRQRKLDKPLYQQRLLTAWPEVLGPNIQAYTQSLEIKNKVLYVSITSAVLRHDLFLSRAKIVESLNKKVGSEVIKDIVFR